jgi:hypothetical protein
VSFARNGKRGEARMCFGERQLFSKLQAASSRSRVGAESSAIDFQGTLERHLHVCMFLSFHYIQILYTQSQHNTLSFSFSCLPLC